MICIWFGIMVTTATMTSLNSSRPSHGCMCWWKFGKVAHVVTIIHLKQQPAKVHLASMDLFSSLMFGEAPIGCYNSTSLPEGGCLGFKMGLWQLCIGAVQAATTRESRHWIVDNATIWPSASGWKADIPMEFSKASPQAWHVSEIEEDTQAESSKASPEAGNVAKTQEDAMAESLEASPEAGNVKKSQ